MAIFIFSVYCDKTAMYNFDGVMWGQASAGEGVIKMVQHKP
jgi:hypothetical protein